MQRQREATCENLKLCKYYFTYMKTIFKQIKLDLRISCPEIFEHKRITNSRRQKAYVTNGVWRSQLGFYEISWALI